MLMGSVGRAPRAGGLLGLMTLKPLRSGLSLQSIVAPRSFSTLSAGYHNEQIALVLDDVIAARGAERIERQRAGVLAVG